MLLTILTPTLNCGAFLDEALASAEALAALLPGEVEHLIGDAGSNDGTWECLAGYAARNGFAERHAMPGCSIPRTLNALLDRARGDWLIVLNGDDVLMPAAVARMLAGRAAPPPMILCGDIVLLTREGVVIGTRGCELPGIHRGMSVNHAATITARAAFAIAGRFSEANPTSYDYEWLWRSRSFSIPFAHEPVILATFRLGGLGVRRRADSNYEVARSKFAAGHRFEGARYYAVNTVKRWFQVARLDPAHRLALLGRKLTRNPVRIIPKHLRAKARTPDAHAAQ